MLWLSRRTGLQETLEVAYNNELAKSASTKASKADKVLWIAFPKTEEMGGKIIDVWHRHEERVIGRRLELFQNLLESKKEADKQWNHMRLQILCRRCGSEMELFSIVYLKDNELWVIGGWHLEGFI